MPDSAMPTKPYVNERVLNPGPNTSTKPVVSRECMQSAIIGAACMALLIAAAVLVSMWFGGGR